MRTALIAAALLLAPAVAGAQGSDRFTSGRHDTLAGRHYRAGWDLLLTERWDDAAREFQAAIDLKDTFKLAHYGLGRAHMGRKKFADAVRAYERCRRLYEQQALQDQANGAQAEQTFSEDLRQLDVAIGRLRAGAQPDASDAIAQLSVQRERLLKRLGDPGTRSLTYVVPPFVSVALGSAYFRSERFADAEASYKAAVEVDARCGAAFSNLAALYLATGRYREAAAALKAAEKSGFRVHPALKQEIQANRDGGAPRP